jgi:hypothetical protein
MDHTITWACRALSTTATSTFISLLRFSHPRISDVSWRNEMHSPSESCSSTGSGVSKYSTNDILAESAVSEILQKEYNGNIQVNDAVLHSHFRTDDVPRGAVIAAQEALSTDVKAGRDHLLQIREAKMGMEMHSPLVRASDISCAHTLMFH